MSNRKIISGLIAGAVVASLTGAGGATAAASKQSAKRSVKKPASKITVPSVPVTTAKASVAAIAPVSSPAPSGGRVAQTGTSSTSGVAKKGGTFVSLVLATGDPDHIEPAQAHTVEGMYPTGALFDGLVDIDYETGEVKNAVADSWTANSDGTVYTFKLKRGVKFHNGESVLPSSFKCAWDRVANPALASEVSYHLDVIKGKADVDDGKAKSISGVVADDANLTLTVTLERPYTAFVTSLQHTVFSPNTKAHCAAGKDYEQGIIVGNGPFKMAEPWRHDQSIKLVANTDYYGGHQGHGPYLDGVEFRITKDILAAYNLFESGTGDSVGIPGGRFVEATSKYGDRAAKKPRLVIQYFGFNWTDPTVGGFANAKLRQAVSAAINRTQLNDLIFNGSQFPATGFTPPGVAGYRAGLVDYIKPTADVAGAKKLLAEWGKPLPKLTLRVNNTSNNIQIATIVANNLKDVGIEVDLDPRPSTNYFTELANKNDHQFFRSGWAYDFASIDNGLYPLFHTATIGQDNAAKFSNALFDRYVEEARRTTDPTRQAQLYQQAEKAVLDQAIAVPLLWQKWATVLSKRVDNFPQGPTSFIDWNEVSLK